MKDMKEKEIKCSCRKDLWWNALELRGQGDIKDILTGNFIEAGNRPPIIQTKEKIFDKFTQLLVLKE